MLSRKIRNRIRASHRRPRVRRYGPRTFNLRSPRRLCTSATEHTVVDTAGVHAFRERPGAAAGALSRPDATLCGKYAGRHCRSV